MIIDIVASDLRIWEQVAGYSFVSAGKEVIWRWLQLLNEEARSFYCSLNTTESVFMFSISREIDWLYIIESNNWTTNKQSFVILRCDSYMFRLYVAILVDVSNKIIKQWQILLKMCIYRVKKIQYFKLKLLKMF
jgi:hypothetical protein